YTHPSHRQTYHLHYTHCNRTGLKPANGGFNHYNQLHDREQIKAHTRIDESLEEFDHRDGLSFKAPLGKLHGIYQTVREITDYAHMSPEERAVQDAYSYQRFLGKNHDQALK